MVRLFLSIYQALRAHRLVALLALLAFIAGAVTLALRMDYEEDIARFLPRNEQNQRFSDVYQSMSSGGRIAVLFQGDNTDSIEAAMDVFADRLAALDTLHVVKDLQVRADESQMLDVVQFVYEHAPCFMTSDDWRRADSLLSQPGFVARQVEENKQLLQLPTAGTMVQGMRYDPLHLFSPMLSRLQSFRMNEAFTILNGCVFTQDGHTGLAFLTSPYGVSESLHNHELQQLLSEAISQTRLRSPAVRVSAVGASLIAAGNASQIKQDSMLAVAISVTLILLLLVWHYRRLSYLLWIGLSLAFGWLFAIAGMSLFADTVSVIVLGIGSVIIGIAVNYPLHYLDHLKETADQRQALRDMVPPLLIGNVTTVSAFLCLVWLDAQAMRDLGLFGSLMLIGTILFVLVFLPQKKTLPPAPPCREGSVYSQGGDFSESGKGRGSSERNFLAKAVVAVRRQKGVRMALFSVFLLLTLVFGWYSLRTSFDSDIRHINFMTPEQQEGLALLAQSQNKGTVYAVSEAADMQSALRQSETVVEPRLRQLQHEGVVSRVSGVGSFLPSQERQAEAVARWNAFWATHRDRVRGELQREAARQGFSATAFEPFLRQIGSELACDSTGSELLSGSPLLSLAANYLQTADDGRTRVLSFVQTADEARVKQSIGQAPHAPVFAFSSSDISNQLVQILSDSFNYIGIVCGFVVFFFLWVSFGRLELSLLSFLPLAVSWLWILGIMQLLGIQFNIVNIILATFIFGQGDDYTIFMTEGLITEHATGRQRLASYKRSVALSAVLMFIGIGSLILARHPALRSLAQVTIIGMATVVLMAFYLPPLVFRWITRHASGQLRAVPLTLGRLGRSLFSIVFFLLAMYLFLLPYTWLSFHLGRVTEARRLRYHRLLQRMSAFVIRHVPGVDFHLDNSVGETFQRPSVIVCNHQSHLDLMCLMMLSPRIIFLTNDWVWRNPFYGAVVHHAEYYPVSNGIEHHVQELRSLYERGYSIAVFPEGTRSEDCSILRFHKGAFYLAEQLGADILPVYLHGVGHVLPKRDFMLRQGRIDVRVGHRLPPGSPLLSGTLLERTKAFRRQYVQHYEALCRQIETPRYFQSYVRYQYLYKGFDVERRASRNIRQAVSELQGETHAEATIRIADPGQGEKALLLALTHPQQQVVATIAREDDYLVATHLPAPPSNLFVEYR